MEDSTNRGCLPSLALPAIRFLPKTILGLDNPFSARWTSLTFVAKSLPLSKVSAILLLSFASLGISAQPIIYKDKVFEGSPTFTLTASNNGSRFINCTFKNYTSSGSVIRIDGANGVVIEGCTFENISNSYNKDAHAIDVLAKGDNIVIRNCTFHNVHGDGVQLGNNYYSASAPYIGKVEISGCHWYVDQGVDTENFVDIKGSSGPILIKNNKIHGAQGCVNKQGCTGDPGYGIIIHYQKSKNIIIDGNTIYDCNYGITSEPGASDNPNAPGPPVDVIVRNNVVYNIDKTGIRNRQGINHSIVNNTVVNSNLDNSSEHANIKIDRPTGVTVNKNNLTAGSGGSDNSFGGQGNLYFSNTNAAGLVNLGSNNYRLTTNSPAKNAGVAISSVSNDIDGDSRPQGSAYDVGADEFSEPINPPAAANQIWLEAECATSIGSFWQKVTDGGTSAGSYLQTNTRSGDENRQDPNRQIVFTFSVQQAGIYQLFARQRADNEGDDSFYYQINDQAWQAWYTPRTGSFAWQTVGTVSLTAGSNTLRFANREKGARLDKLLLTQTGSAPSGLGQAASNCTTPPPPPTSVVTANAGLDQTVALDSEPVKLSGSGKGPSPFRGYLWEKVSGPSLTLDARGANATLTNLQIGTYEFKFTATDSEGNSGSDNVKVIVTASNARTASSTKGRDLIEENLTEAGSTLIAFPNPADDRLIVQLANGETRASVLQLTNLMGQVLRRLEVPVSGGPLIHLDTKDIPAGIYLVQWQTDRLHTVRLLIEH